MSESHLSCVTLFSWRLADGDLPQESIICVQHCREIDIQWRFKHEV